MTTQDMGGSSGNLWFVGFRVCYLVISLQLAFIPCSPCLLCSGQTGDRKPNTVDFMNDSNFSLAYFIQSHQSSILCKGGCSICTQMQKSHMPFHDSLQTQWKGSTSVQSKMHPLYAGVARSTSVLLWTLRNYWNFWNLTLTQLHWKRERGGKHCS